MAVTSMTFDESYYLNQNPDVLTAILNGFFTSGQQHFQLVGYKELRDPNQFFDTSYYLTQNTDVLNAGVNPFSHFVTTGVNENRAPTEALASAAAGGFDSATYLSNNTDVQAAITAGTFSSAYQHWILVGQFEGRAAQTTSGTTLTGASSTTTSGSSFTLTTGTDSFTGTSSNDTFDASGFFNSGTGTTLPVLSNADSLNGGAGTDTLNVLLTANSTVAPAALSNIEVINLTATTNATPTLSLANATGVTTLGALNSTVATQFTNLQSAATAFNMTNTNQNFSVTAANTALAGTADAATLTLNGVTGGTVTLQTTTAASGYETLSVVSAGNTANTLAGLTDGNGTSLATVNISGSQNLTITAALDGSVTTVNAASATGNVSVNHSDNAAVVTITGGAGNDTIDLGNTFVGAENATVANRDTINGGAGTDTLILASAQAVAASGSAQSTVSNIEAIAIEDAVGGNINLTRFDGATSLVFQNATVGAHTFTLSSGNSVTHATGDNGDNARTFTISGTGTSDTLTVNTVAATDLGTALQTYSGVEVLNFNTGSTAGAAVEIGGNLTVTPTAGGTGKIVVTGANDLDINGTITASELDASGMTGNGNLDMTGGLMGAQAAKITGGSSADIIRGGSANDILIGGSGADSFIFAASGTNGQDTLTDFTINSDTLVLTAMTAGAGTEATEITSASAAVATTNRVDFVQVINTDGTAASITTGGTATLAAADFTAGTLTNVAAFIAEKFTGNSSTTGTDTGVYLINYTASGSTTSYLYQWDNDTTANVTQAAELSLVGIITRDGAIDNNDITP